MMLGAQARAAEYNAAKNASARQATREAEEQKLPPKATPISLGAFTRNVQINRNKGTKNWVPLVLEDVGEDDEILLDTSDHSRVSSKEQPSSPGSKQGTPSGSQPDSTDRIRVNMPMAVIPIAPRAMRLQGQPSALPSPVALMTQQQTAFNDTPGIIPMALYAGNPGTQTVDMFHYSHYGWMPSLPVFDQVGHLPDTTPEGMRRFGGMMVPTDLTPTKQEQKLSMLSQTQRNPLYAIPDNSLPAYQEPIPTREMHTQAQLHNLLGSVHAPMWDINLQSLQTAQPNMPRRPELQHVHSDLTQEPTNAIFDPQPNLVRHASLPARDHPVTPPRTVDALQILDTPPALMAQENDQPYDRASKMQKFIAAQQAVAKTGKTVLHNPDLRKSQQTKPEPKADEDNVNGTPVKTQEDELLEQEVIRDTRTRIVPKTPPGLGGVRRASEMSELEFVEPTSGPQNVVLHHKFGVGTEDWIELKPITRNERWKMLDVMKYAAPDEERRRPSFAGSAKDPLRLEAIKAWLHSDPRGFQAVRKEVDEIASDYSARFRSSESNSVDHDTGGSSNMDVPAGLVRGAGNILANLTEYVVERKLEHPPDDCFSRTKPVPEFAVERGGLGANLGALSLFEDGGSGFYNPPNRIARDPRFRSQTQEGAMSKSEEDWKNRHEMYGRRRL